MSYILTLMFMFMFIGDFLQKYESKFSEEGQ